ncbi:hypothetical protein NBRC116587_14510 [Pseudoteredinibacter isoporae]
MQVDACVLQGFQHWLASEDSKQTVEEAFAFKVFRTVVLTHNIEWCADSERAQYTGIAAKTDSFLARVDDFLFLGLNRGAAT